MTLKIAQQLAARGFAVFPIAEKQKAPPLWRDWPKQATTQPKEATWPKGANVGVHARGMVVVDVDPRKGGFDTLLALELEEKPFPVTLTAKTPSGGQHLFYRLPQGHPGVPNTVEHLGDGIDTRSTGGYVVGAGSEIKAGKYEWANDAPIAPAPGWMVEALGVAAPKSAPAAPVAPAEPAALERAAAMLQSRPPAIEGQGGDAHTYATAAMLRDYGVSAAQAIELLTEHWNPRCEPPWALSDLSAKVEHAYRYATGQPASKAVTADDFEAIDAPQPTPKRKVKTFGEMAGGAALSAPHLVKGLLFKQTYAMLYGAPGVGKTFVALDLARHVAAGADWHGRKVRQGRVLYVGFEAFGGLPNRAHALQRHYQDADGLPLHFTGGGFNLRDAAGRAEFKRLLDELPEPPALIIFDTFAYALAGGDENSAEDTGAFHHAAQAIIAATGACVMVIHHPGKDASRGARGSSTIHAAVDTELHVLKGRIESIKQRDVELAAPIGFKLQPITIGIDDDGDPITSCVVDPAPVETEESEDLTGNNKAGLEVLIALSPNNEPVHWQTWMDRCLAEFLTRKKPFYDIKLRLQRMGYININNEMVTRSLE